jgi:hypothetical protein
MYVYIHKNKCVSLPADVGSKPAASPSGGGTLENKYVRGRG